MAACEKDCAMTADRLAGAEERLALALRNTDMGLWEWDIQTDAVVVDTSWQRMLGLKEDEAGSDFTALFSRMNSEDVSTFQIGRASCRERV